MRARPARTLLYEGGASRLLARGFLCFIGTRFDLAALTRVSRPCRDRTQAGSRARERRQHPFERVRRVVRRAAAR